MQLNGPGPTDVGRDGTSHKRATTPGGRRGHNMRHGVHNVKVEGAGVQAKA